MGIRQINQGIRPNVAIIFPCYNCAMHHFISFERIRIDNYKCLQKAKCQICKFEWIEFWYMAEQHHSFRVQSHILRRNKKISRQEKRMELQLQ